MPFHRFKDATYDILPGDTYAAGVGTIGGVAYDRANVTSEGAGTPADGSALADIAKTGGVNLGTYWVAFGENATSLFTNRGFRAGSENTDMLDDILRENIPAFTDSVSAVSTGLIYHVLTGEDVFVGGTGAPAGQPNAYLYATVVDDQGSAIYNAGARVEVNDIQPTAGGPSVVGSNGYETSPRVTFNLAIPTGTNFTILFGSRRSYARMVEEANKHETNLNLVELHRALAEAAHIQYSGLNEMYRRSTKVAGGTSGDALSALVSQDTAGDGAVITRDGQALTTKGVPVDQVTTAQTVATGPDPFLALMRGELASYTSSSFVGDFSGDIGYLFLTSHRHTGSDSNENSSQSRPLAAVASYNPVDITGATVGSQPVYTRIQKGATAILNKTGASGSDSVTLTATDNVFQDGSGDTAIFLKADVLLVTFLSDNSQQAYIIHTIVGDEEATLRTLGGSTPTFDDDVAVTVQWFQLVGTFGGNPTNADSVPAFCHIVPHALSSAGTTSVNVARLIARESGDIILAIGHHELDGSPANALVIRGDGSMSGGRLQGLLSTRHDEDDDIATSPETKFWDPTATGGSALKGGTISLRSTAGPGAQTINLSWSVTLMTYTPELGDRLTLIIENAGGATITMGGTVWSDIQFSGGDDNIPVDVGFVAKYELVYTSISSGNKWLATRTAYDLSP